MVLIIRKFLFIIFRKKKYFRVVKNVQYKEGSTAKDDDSNMIYILTIERNLAKLAGLKHTLASFISCKEISYHT